ncbi:mediator complex subunit 13 C-terminal-domain-containing protein [Bisporella sp. PMI_857]|nr:mediator complex subunit 13 C-terminal-domain-containing protein [Bisporella sp. PMI_857]
MEPGDYSTNVLSSSNYTSIQYEYFELQSGSGRNKLQKLEAQWRDVGILVHCDPRRDGIWRFKSLVDNESGLQTNGREVAESFTENDAQGNGLLLRDKGTYEPASLLKSRLPTSSSFSSPSISSSPSSSIDATVRNAQSINSRAVQGNAGQSITNELALPSPGPKSATILNWPTPKDIHEGFISAVLGSIVYFLCRDHGFIPLNSRTLISTIPKASHMDVSSTILGAEAATLATLDISHTSLGTLVIKGQSDSAPGLQNLSAPASMVDGSPALATGAALWLAPGGNAARYYGSQDEKKLPGTLPISQLQPNVTSHQQTGLGGATISTWQFKCLEWLSSKGLDTVALEKGGWAFVQIISGNPLYLSTDHPVNPLLEDFAVVPWPALLCYQTTNVMNCGIPQLVASSTTSGSPLSFAEEWYSGQEERANLITKRQKERHSTEMRSKEQADIDTRTLQSVSYSSMALRRGSNAGAMYPTPPDALHHPVGATPSFDGTVSTPGNPNNMFAQDGEQVQRSSNTGVVVAESEIWPSSGRKEHSNMTTNIGTNFNDNDNDNDNIFGDDVGGDLFGGDITDADFNFFDEPDNIDLDQHPPASDDVVMMSEGANDMLDMLLKVPGPVAPVIHQESEIMSFDESNKDSTKIEAIIPEDDMKQESHGSVSKDMKRPPRSVMSPPFNMDFVYKKVVQNLPLEGLGSSSGRASTFSKIEFKPSLLSVNEKYGINGRFNISDEEQAVLHDSSGLRPTETSGWSKKLTRSEHESRKLARILQVTDHELEFAATFYSDMLTDADAESLISEQDDASYTADDTPSIFNQGVKRKWTEDDEDEEDMASSFNALAVEHTQSVGTPMSTTSSQIPLLEVDPADWALANYFTSPEPDFQPNALSDTDCIASAQILAEQAVTGNVRLPSSGGFTPSDSQMSSYKISSTRDLIRRLRSAASSCLKETTACTMRSFLDIQGIPVSTQSLRLPPRPTPHPRGTSSLDGQRPSSPFLIPPPPIEVRRGDTKLTLLSSSINFWDTLSLSPSRGNKDVTAMCIYPNSDGLAESASIFLDQMKSIYESSRLGSHDRITAKDIPNGLMPFTVDPAPQINKSHQLSTLKDTTARISRALAALPVEETNFVVYFVYPVDNSTILVHICSAFQHLFNVYKKILAERKANTANELVLQLIPMDFIASPTAIIVPSPSEYARLAMEVYDRCYNFSSHSSPAAIFLDQPLPKTIDFRLSPNPSASLLQENSCLHLAYAQSIDDRWITAAWTDSRGAQQMTASYCLGRKNEPISTPFSVVANEIWETTLDYISKKKVHWRLMIARVGVMEPSEIDFWTGLAATESDAQINLTLLTVQTDPSVNLLPPHITLTPNTNAPQSIVTPVSTPQASILSPEAASTPSRDNPAGVAFGDPVEPDSDARLIDFTDQSWGAVLSHRLNNSNSLLELNPTLISGYLVKRGGANLDDPPVAMEVNIVHCEVSGNPRTFHEGLLKEILIYYRSLGTLARARGMVDAIKDIRPWHIAAAEKAVKALYMLQ